MKSHRNNQQQPAWPAPRRGLGQSLDSIPRGRGRGRNAVKRAIYPVWSVVEKRRVKRRESLLFEDHDVSMSLRGTEYDLLLSKLGRKISGARVLLQGVGAGEETELWEPFTPGSLVGIDYEVEPGSGSLLLCGDLAKLPLGDSTFDIAASLNVFEHVKDVEAVLAETGRVLASPGWFVASFGPLYRAFGGDHFSSLRGGLEYGYNHLLLETEDYRDFVRAMTIEGEDTVDGEPRHGLAYIRDDLFSHLSVDDYRLTFESHMHVSHFRGYVDPNGLKFRKEFTKKWNMLLDKGYREKDLLVSTITVIGRMRNRAGAS